MEIPNIPGLDFHPTDDELLTYYLKQRILNHFQDPTRSANAHTVPDIELYTMHPKELPRQFKRLAKIKSNGREWVFFCARKGKYRNSSRAERTVPNIGYWKVTSKLKKVKSETTGNEIGSKNILTFYERSPSNGAKTNWILHEYHLNASSLGYNVSEMPFVVCRLYNKSGNCDESTCHGDESTNCAAAATSETHATGYQFTSPELVSEEEIWQSLPQIQQLPCNLSNYGNYTGRAEEDLYTDEAGSSSGGYYTGGSSSNCYYPSNDETSYYQPCHGGWGSHYY
ncbi:NAC domain-containing protein 14-like [Punica granatum]|uniref:NAC domain-containing protein n=2 Tax=Punica granatum TaxID=22663 RepID=A0A218VSZ7_PUNGR|nr:NAC domain-containing protein 14-like [Punica granatum]OWM63684.1 hypothetical protein CDL15_Pgr008227 [Punica granatum]PKI65703.1 hypothetical protein CRG98_013892 [Punica granatum]